MVIYRNLKEIRWVVFTVVCFLASCGGDGGQVASTAGSQTHTIQAGELEINVDQKGIVQSLRAKSGQELISDQQPQPLLSLIIASTPQDDASVAKRYFPIKLDYLPSTSTYHFTFEKGVSASVTVQEKPGYARLELTDIQAPQDMDVRIALWGPFGVNIVDNVADILGVAYDQEFAVGIQGLNVKTIGGWPNEYNFLGFRDKVLDGTQEWQRATRFEYEGSAARITEQGAILQFYSRDYTKARTINAFTAPEVNDLWPLEALVDEESGKPWPEAQLEGSALAIFGVSRDNHKHQKNRLASMKNTILDRVELIEIEENLPRPTFDGEWAKRSKGPLKPYLILTDLGVDTFQKSIDYARKAGLDYLYHDNPWGVYETHGHYQVQSAYDGDDADNLGSDEELAAVIAKAKEQGIDWGTHSLVNFILPKDAYVTPVPHPDLAYRTHSPLAAPIDSATTDLLIKPDPGFNITTFASPLRFVRIGEELISYEEAVAEGGNMRLTGVTRGIFGTRALSHEVGELAYRLMYVGGFYDVFLGGHNMFPEMTTRIAESINNTGLKLWSFDGLDGATRTGYDHLAANDFVERVYRKLDDPDGFVFDVAYFNHYLWHAVNRLNWGEVHGKPAYEAHRALRWGYQAFYARNMIPPMLGWFRIEPETPVEELEWAYSKAASFDAGYALTTNTKILDNKTDAEAILNASRVWEQAKVAGAFTDEQKMRMRDPRSFWHLEEVAEGSEWRLWRIEKETGKKIGEAEVVKLPSEEGHGEYNISGDAMVSVSSALDNTFVGARVIDGQTGVYAGAAPTNSQLNPEDGYALVVSNDFPGLNGSGEWASNGEASPWVELKWNQARHIQRIMLFDRATLASNARGGVLVLSDGRKITFDGLANDSDPLTLEIGGAPVEGIKLILDGEGDNIGLAEIVVIAKR